ncbi:MAG: hypothetical protein RL662_1 [Bacteroidota bacterium]|jgi:hypothetical protein
MQLKAAITIPVYKTEMSKYELISYSQALKIFKNYDIVLFCPASLDVSQYKEIAHNTGKNVLIETFDSSYFKDIQGYNKLMLSTSFYERFLSYTYILVYQLDCFVFRNELEDWMQRGYDYIGAPWITNDRRTWWTLKRSIRYTLKSLYRRYTNQYNNATFGFYKVGNGGFSLRRIDRFLEIIKRFGKNGRIDKYRNMGEDYAYAEDVFWGLETNRYCCLIKTPSYKEALNFSFDINPSICYDLNNNLIPFGCHAWSRYTLKFWQPFIKDQGYSL